MRRFAFSLERVREWREKQLAVEDAKLERLFAELAAIQTARANIDEEQRHNDESVAEALGVTGVELRALDEFRRFARSERERLMRLENDCCRRIAGQQQVILEAKRKCELLDRLKARKLRGWTAEFDREIEAQAAEAFLAKWNAGEGR
jgi:ATP-dependent Clp protease ATP-binding subunit ClpA